MVVGLLGILKAGGAYLPLDPEYPRERLSDMVADAGLRVVLMQERACGGAAAAGRGSAASCSMPMRSSGEHDRPLRVDRAGCSTLCMPAHLAYMIYTSGSTGRPKGAANTHAGLHNRLLGCRTPMG